MTLTPAQREELTEAFEFVCRRYRLSDNSRSMAWAAAMVTPERGWKVYQAIWRSYGPTPN